MNLLPLYPNDVFGFPTGLLLGTLIGFAFGFVLERAGFGNAKNLAAQFYLTDTRVLKVMFSAIATACAGLALLSGLGVLDLSLGQVEAGLEELGVDLRLFEEAMASAHPLCLPMLDSFYEGYGGANPDASAVRAKAEDIRARGRYR